MNLEKQDIQGLLVRGYRQLPNAAYALLQIRDPDQAAAYLNTLADEITTAEVEPERTAIHLAFAYPALQKLGLPANSRQSFSRQFKEGMTETHRQSILGDREANDPTHWTWGGPENESIDLLLLLYATNSGTLDQLHETQKRRFESAGLVEIRYLPTEPLADHKEHFGFRDGISQPMVRGFGKSDQLPDSQTIPTGEFVLGYHNWYEQYPDSPHVAPEDDPENLLPSKPDQAEFRDLGKNGSYLVFRQLSQNVPAFWNYMKEQSSVAGDANTTKAAVTLASKMVGRWPSGAPLVKAPEKDDPTLAQENDFLYWNEDKEGLKCPLGAHIRRTNPRDWLLTEKTDVESVEMVRKHRLLRRGRSYGPPLIASMNTEEILDAPADDQPRGLHFICFVGDIIRQFEFVQNAWVTFHKFGGLYEDSDPLIGTHFQKEGVITDTFTVQSLPVRKRCRHLPQFTKIEGGAYFFFPGIRAIKYLATVATSTSADS
jgi:Dyp-type peroxidase family